MAIGLPVTTHIAALVVTMLWIISNYVYYLLVVMVMCTYH